MVLFKLQSLFTLIVTLVDGVKKVMELDLDHIESVPKISTQIITDSIKGMGKHVGKFIIILDIVKRFSGNEIAWYKMSPNQSRKGFSPFMSGKFQK
jgi:chemotaxis signal transduction protein